LQPSNFLGFGIDTPASTQGTITSDNVDWYTFTLSTPAIVTIQSTTTASTQPLTALLSLYDNAGYDPEDMIGHHLLARSDAATQGGQAQIQRLLGAGTYYVAVSGSGNAIFNPLLADSGLVGSTGDYNLALTAADPQLNPAAGVTVLNADPAPGEQFTASPFWLNFQLNEPLPSDYSGNIQLYSSLSGNFDLDGVPVGGGYPFLTQNFNTNTNTLELQLQAPLAPGHYRIVLPGIASPPDASGNQSPDFQDDFDVTGVEGTTVTLPFTDTPPLHDTVATAYQAGDISDGHTVLLSGALGTDPTYPDIFSAGNQVDFYRFHVGGNGPFALTAEVYAGRIDSLLTPGLSLYRVDGNQYTFLASNDGTFNGTSAGGFQPLYTDPALFAGLAPGHDYVLAVSSVANMPDEFLNPPQNPGDPGILDPGLSHSASNGGSVGQYVIGFHIVPAGNGPSVVSSSIGSNAVLSEAPGSFQITFDAPVNLVPLSYDAWRTTTTGAMSQVYIAGADGQPLAYPRLDSFDPTTDVAQFILLDPLPNGSYTLHLVSGTSGITDFAGTPLHGNDPSGDYVIPFSVAGPQRGSPGDPLTWIGGEANDSLANPQVIGPLFPDELSTQSTVNGVAIVRNPTAGSTDTEDVYQIELTQTRQYLFYLNSTTLPPGTTLDLLDANGKLVTSFGINQATFPWELSAGTYYLRVSGWDASPTGAYPASSIAYVVNISIADAPENPTPLVVGTGPALRIRLVSTPPSSNSPSSPTLNGPAAPTPASPDGGSAQVASLAPLSPGLTGGVTLVPVNTSAPVPLIGLGSIGGSLATLGRFDMPGSAASAQNINPLGSPVPSLSSSDGPLVRVSSSPSTDGSVISAGTITQAPLGSPIPNSLLSQSGDPSGQPAPMSDEALRQLVDALFLSWDQIRNGLTTVPVTPPADEKNRDVEPGTENDDSEASLRQRENAPEDHRWASAGAVIAGWLLAAPRRDERSRGRGARSRMPRLILGL
jgi:hypothetical protein